jgi:hypothetical protein
VGSLIVRKPRGVRLSGTEWEEVCKEAERRGICASEWIRLLIRRELELDKRKGTNEAVQIKPNGFYK